MTACLSALLAVAPVAPAEVAFRHVVVDAANPQHPHCKGAGDLDGDGRTDLVVASAGGGGLFWYRWPDWTKHRLADGAFTTDLAVADVTGDGCPDVVVPNDQGLQLYRNPRGRGGDPARDAWEPINLGAAGARMHDVRVADLDGDGRLDVVARHQSGFGKQLGNAVHLWYQEAVDRWRHERFACPHGEGLELADLDGDGRPDVIIGGRWYRNPGGRGGLWTAHLYLPAPAFESGWTKGDVKVAVGDLNGDGRPDIVLTPAEGRGRFSWFEAPADPRSPDWREHVVQATLDHAHGLALGDLNGDGRLEVVVAKMHQATAPRDVTVWWNGGDGSWRPQVVATTGIHNIQLVDVGASGRLSIFGANWNDAASTHGAVELWVNAG